MVVDPLSRIFTTEFISALLQQGYNNLAKWLERVAKGGTPTQQKRIPDCWVILSLDIGEGWREDRAINGFLKILNEQVEIGIDSDVVRMWLRVAHEILSRHVQSQNYTSTEAFCLRLLEAFAPSEVWDLKEFGVPNQT